jgi:hypothetical protein
MIELYVLYFLIGLAIGYNSRRQPRVDYEKIDAKIRDDLEVAKNLNESLLKDKHDLQEKLWKLKNEKKV